VLALSTPPVLSRNRGNQGRPSFWTPRGALVLWCVYHFWHPLVEIFVEADLLNGGALIDGCSPWKRAARKSCLRRSGACRMAHDPPAELEFHRTTDNGQPKRSNGLCGPRPPGFWPAAAMHGSDGRLPRSRPPAWPESQGGS
jgi:hypothetical protein